jgi:hypothetical protein
MASLDEVWGEQSLYNRNQFQSILPTRSNPNPVQNAQQPQPLQSQPLQSQPLQSQSQKYVMSSNQEIDSRLIQGLVEKIDNHSKNKKKRIKKLFEESETEAEMIETETDTDTEYIRIARKPRHHSKKKSSTHNSSSRNYPYKPNRYVEPVEYVNNRKPVNNRNSSSGININLSDDLDIDFPKSRILLLGCGVFLLYAFDALRKS